MNEKEIRLKKFTLNALADMICGNKPYETTFPYRNSSQLTSFFRDDLGLPYMHNGSTRKNWVFGVLEELNNEGPHAHNILSDKILEILKKLFDPKYIIPHAKESAFFLGGGTQEQLITKAYNKAIDAANTVLKHIEIEITKDNNKNTIHIKNINKTLISTNPFTITQQKKFEVAPHFNITGQIEQNLVSVMMPFATEFNNVHNTIKDACDQCRLSCKRADDIWEESVIVDDVANLIFRSKIVIVDLTKKNSNVLYETGIAHAWGKLVIPIAQNTEHLPFDLAHHRILTYLSNTEGLQKFKKDLIDKLKQITSNNN